MQTMTNKKNIINLGLPEGAVSDQLINKINEIYLSRILEDGGVADLMPVLGPFSEGKILEHIGQMKRAKETFQRILKKNPTNRWAIEALKQVEMSLH